MFSIYTIMVNRIMITVLYLCLLTMRQKYEHCTKTRTKFRFRNLDFGKYIKLFF